MDPLSVIASITTILTAATQVSRLLSQVHNAPESMNAILTEIEYIEIVFRALKRFVDRARFFDQDRAALLQVEDVTTILTRMALDFGQLQKLMSPFSPHRKSGVGWRLTWAHQKSNIGQLVHDLQRQQTSLSLLLQLIQW